MAETMLRMPVGLLGGEPTPADPEDKYKASAKLAFYKKQLNERLRQKNPEAFDNYIKGLAELRRVGNQRAVEEYIQKHQYNDYLSPKEVRDALGEKGYSRYLDSLKRVNAYNVAQKQRPLYGEIEGESDINNLNYGRRFASLQVTPSLDFTLNSDSGTSRTYSRFYKYNPAKDDVEFEESGDLAVRPEYLSVPKSDPKVMLRLNK